MYDGEKMVMNDDLWRRCRLPWVDGDGGVRRYGGEDRHG